MKIFEGTVVQFQGKRYMVKKINPKNYVATDTAGRDWNIRRGFTVTRDENQTWEGQKFKTEYDVYLEQRDAGYTLGSIVRLTGAAARKYPGVHVVIALRSDGTYRLAKLGGDGGRYLRGFKAADLEKVEL